MNISKSTIMFLWGALEVGLIWGTVAFPFPKGWWNAPLNSETWVIVFPVLLFCSSFGILFSIGMWIYNHWDDK